MQGIQTTNTKTGLSLFLPISKIGNDEERMCWGYASTEAMDSEGEIVTRQALEGALPDYMKFANIREMHQLSAAGIAKEADIDSKGLYIGAEVIDDSAWAKVKKKVYKGFSIGGRATARDPHNRKIITGLELIEISLVDRPANPEALIEVWKAEKDFSMAGEKKHDPAQTWNCGLPGHAHNDKNDAIKCMKSQEERFGKNMPTAQTLAKSLADVISALDSEGLAKASAVLEDWEKTELQRAAEKNEPTETIRSVEKTDRETTKPKLNGSSTGNSRLDKGLAEAQAIIDRANSEGSPSASNKEKSKMPNTTLAKLGKPDAIRSVEKGIETVISALSLLENVNRIKSCLIKEQNAEGDSSDQVERWGNVLEMMAGLIQDLAKEEIGELLTTGRDIDFRYGDSMFMGWAAKAMRPAIISMTKERFTELFAEVLGDDTKAPNYLALSEFAEKAGGSLSIEEWDNRGEGTGWGAHSSDSNDRWGYIDSAKSVQEMHDASVVLGAACDMEKKKKPPFPPKKPNGQDDGDEDDKKVHGPGPSPSESLPTAASGSGHSNMPGAKGPGAPKDPPKELTEGEGTRNEKDKDPDDPPAKKAKKSDKLVMAMLAQMAKTNEQMLEITKAALSGNQQVGRDPPKPAKGTFRTVAKEDDYQPAPGADNSGGSAGNQVGKREEDPQEVLKTIFNQPRFVSR